MSNDNTITIYTDGGSRGNPGPAAIGAYIETFDKGYSKYLGEKTNNEAEYEAVIFGLKKIKSLLGSDKAKRTPVDLYLDSELIANQLNGEYKIMEERLKILFVDVWNAALDFDLVRFYHVPREENEKADALVNKELDAQEREQEELF